MNSKSMRMMETQKHQSRNVVDRINVGVPSKVFSSSSSSSSSVAATSSWENPSKRCCYHAHAELLVQNYSNFKRSGQPVRFLYYSDDGYWVDFPVEIFNSLRSGFLEGKPVVEVEIDGSGCLFDFYRMVQIHLESGKQISIAWIDAENKCFFPEVFVGGGGGEFENFSGNPNTEIVSSSENPKVEIAGVKENLSSGNPKIEVEIIIAGDSNSNLSSGKRKRQGVDVESEGLKEETQGSSSNCQSHGAKRRQCVVSDLGSPRWPKAKLLKPGDKAYSIVENLFSTWLRIVEPSATITAIHQCLRTGPLDRARYQVFQKQMEIMKAARGDSNMVFAWHGTSAKGVESILAHGFSMPNKISGSEAHGVGVYLSPAKSPHMSAMLSEVDENGEKHVILCRVILGNREKVGAGSQQLYPSNVGFDTGVDDLNNPNWYVVWCANMNTHILPECVVSFKSCQGVPGQLNGSSSTKPVPHALPLGAKLFSKLESSLPPSKVCELRTLCSTYKDKKLGKEIFMKQLRSVVGDDMLRMTIHEIRG
ncbi:unnamed protein product [Ilex paraguariensis]|uniref:Poly [ADP-ribose] polymerase n=1 Tax=Ilex paraguariensis TaxID=185542 RepID=A0ABC8SM34_9AQUA